MSDTGVRLSEVEGIKAASRLLRGTLAESLADAATGALADADTQLSKFHGIYQQDDRDQRNERRERRLEPAWRFMIRVRVPGGVLTPAQWLALDEIARRYGAGSIRLTTRQAVQFHGVLKRELKETVRAINATLLDTLAACGDVNRNVMCTPWTDLSAVHRQALETSLALSAHLTPRTRAYHEIWLDGENLAVGDEPQEAEPIYGRTYLPRKFKTAVVVPPLNDVDVFAQDLGFIAVAGPDDALEGYNVTVGGGMGMSHGEPATWPRLADLLGYCRPEQAVAIAEAVVTTQRDFGDRTDRKHARLKYTIADRGLDWFRTEVERRSGIRLEPPRPYLFTTRGDRYGWARDDAGLWHLALFVASGRLRADEPADRLGGLREIAARVDCELRITANQNLIIARVADEDRVQVDEIARRHGLIGDASATRRAALACVGLPTCGLAMAESERYLPELLARFESLLARHGLAEEAVSLRVTGCPNGCARPYIAEIGLVGKGPGRYNLYLGGDALGQRLNRLYLENVDEAAIFATLDPLLAAWAAERATGEDFGDYLVRAGHVAAVAQPADIHEIRRGAA